MACKWYDLDIIVFASNMACKWYGLDIIVFALNMACKWYGLAKKEASLHECRKINRDSRLWILILCG